MLDALLVPAEENDVEAQVRVRELGPPARGTTGAARAIRDLFRGPMDTRQVFAGNRVVHDFTSTNATCHPRRAMMSISPTRVRKLRASTVHPLDSR